MSVRSRVLTAALGAAVALAANQAQATMPPGPGVDVSGLRAMAAAGILAPPAPFLRSGPTTPEQAAAVGSGTWRVPVVLVAFSDQPLTHTATEFNTILFDTTGVTPTGAVYDYYQWASGGRLRVIPTVVATVRLDTTRAFYGAGGWGRSRLGTPRNAAGFVRDALRKCQGTVDWNNFNRDSDSYVDMIWVVHSGIGGEGSLDPFHNDLWSFTDALDGAWYDSGPFDAISPSGQHLFVNRFSILPELSLFTHGLSEIGVYCHEFGHALGLPDFYDILDPSGARVGPGVWSLMSFGGYGGDGHSPSYPTHPGAWSSLLLGWSSAIHPTQDTTIVLPPLPGGNPAIDLWFQGEPYREHFLVENRRREGFDRNLPWDGIIVTHIDEVAVGSRIAANLVNSGFDPAMRIVEADGRNDLFSGQDKGDTTDCYPGALGVTNLLDGVATPSLESFSGAATNLALRDIAIVPGGTRVHAQVRAPGWQLTADRGDAGYNPVIGFGPANAAAVDNVGNVASVTSELHGGHLQVYLRARENGVWAPTVQVSNSTGSATDPTIAALAGGDLAVAWSDTRDGRSRLYYRARVRGVWGPERSPFNVPGDCLTPAIGVDANGIVQVACANIVAGRVQILLTRFAYLSPFGQAMAATQTSNQPGAPALAVAPDGRSYVLWADQGTNPPSIGFARFDPDSGVHASLPLTPPSGTVQQACHAAVDVDGTLHVVWVVSGPGLSEIHYQRRPRDLPPSPVDMTLEVEGGVVQTPRIAADPQGGLHLGFVSLASRVSQVRYLRSQPDRGWDFSSTEVTLASEGSSQHPTILPTAPNRLTVLFTGYGDGAPHFLERVRLGDQPGLLDVGPTVRHPGASLTLGPNPLRRGQTLELVLTDAAGGGPVEFFDLAGRRVGRLERDAANPTRLRLPPAATAGWATGVYFARVRDGATRAAGSAAVRFVYLR